jgi:hypothetical protein
MSAQSIGNRPEQIETVWLAVPLHDSEAPRLSVGDPLFGGRVYAMTAADLGIALWTSGLVNGRSDLVIPWSNILLYERCPVRQ